MENKFVLKGLLGQIYFPSILTNVDYN